MERRRKGGGMKMVQRGWTHIQNLLSENNGVKGMRDAVFFVTIPHHLGIYENESYAAIRFSIALSRYLCLHGLPMDQVVIVTSEELIKAMIIQEMKTFGYMRGNERKARVMTLGQLTNVVDVVILHLGNRKAPIDNLGLFSLIPKIRKGFYIVGQECNMNFSDQTRWVVEFLKTKKLCGPSLGIQCGNHSTPSQISVLHAENFPRSGGCYLTCNSTLRCGHFCQRLCHPYYPEAHGERDGVCKEICGRKCERGHVCYANCHQSYDEICPPCCVKEKKRFKCGHCVTYECSESEKYIRASCLEPTCAPIIVKLPCGHDYEYSGKRPLRLNPSIKCREKVMKNLPCGHELLLGCQQRVESVPCQWKVEVPRCHHLVPEKVQCYKRNDPLPKRTCISKCWERMLCGHTCLEAQCEGVALTLEEHKIRHPCTNDCKRLCSNKHLCAPKHFCHEPCAPCQFMVTKRIVKKNLDLRNYTNNLDLDADLGLSEDPNNSQYLKLHYRCHAEENLLQKVQRVFKDCFEKPPENCSKSCRRFGHSCSFLHPRDEECPPCPEILSFHCPTCKHEMTYVCDEVDKDYKICWAACDRKRQCEHPCFITCGEHRNGSCPPCNKTVTTPKPCGHMWTHPCHQELPANHKCFEIVDAKSLSTCGHSNIHIQCHVLKEMELGDANILCDAKCDFYFDPSVGGCGHNCSGKCKDCMVSPFHSECTQMADRTLVCGHAFQEMCYMNSPCVQKCETSCKHRRCDLICALPCKPCKEPCVYGCEHGRCTNLCGEPCNKKPCLEKCPKSLKKCGHPCAGFCGEPCPTLCTICDKETLIANNYFGTDKILPSDRFILLVDCGHTFDSETLNNLMNVEVVTGQITVKRCPLCRTVIRNNLRYSSVLKKINDDIESVKKIIFGHPRDIQQKLDEALQLLLPGNKDQPKEIVKPYYLKELRDVISNDILLNKNQDDAKYPNGKRDHFANSTMNMAKASCLLFLANFYTNALQLWNKMVTILRGDDLVEWESFVIDVADVLSNRHFPLRRSDMIVVVQEWDRIVAASRLLSKHSETQPIVVQRILKQPRGRSLYLRAKDILLSYEPFEDSARERFENAYAELEDALDSKLCITEGERMNILEAFDYSVGRWFKCPNGHIYVVTECGGVTEEGSCNECGAKIGGTHHRVLPTNELATEMDDATGPLYPTVFESG